MKPHSAHIAIPTLLHNLDRDVRRGGDHHAVNWLWYSGNAAVTACALDL
jgi:hypothetical protein